MLKQPYQKERQFKNILVALFAIEKEKCIKLEKADILFLPFPWYYKKSNVEIT